MLAPLRKYKNATQTLTPAVITEGTPLVNPTRFPHNSNANITANGILKSWRRSCAINRFSIKFLSCSYIIFISNESHMEFKAIIVHVLGGDVYTIRWGLQSFL